MTSAEIIYESITALREYAGQIGSASLLSSVEKAEDALVIDVCSTQRKQTECNYAAVMAAVFPDSRETAV